MMGYVKKWNPPVLAIRDNLPSWKALFNDLNQNLLDAGLVQTDAPGQLVIDSVDTLPTDNSYAGFMEFAFNDPLQATAPIIIRLEYGCGIEGLDTNTGSSYRVTRMPRVMCTVYFKGVASTPFACPQSHNYGYSGLTNNNTLIGANYLCNSQERGFFGFVYGAGSRGTWPTPAKPYSAATFSVFIQRTLDANMEPTGDGIAMFYNGFDTDNGQVAISGGIWANGTLPASYVEYLPSHSLSRSRQFARRIGMPPEAKAADGDLLFEPIYYSCPGLRPFPYIYSIHYTSLAEGSEFDLEISPGDPLRFVCIGRETSMVPDDYDKQNAALVMLFDEG